MTSRVSPLERSVTSATETGKTIHSMPESLGAERFVKELETYLLPEEREKYRRYFKTGEGQYGEGDAASTGVCGGKR